MLQINQCPVCNAGAFNPYLSCKDYTVSQEVFQIVNCAACGFKFTNPRPEDSVIGKYYKSEDYISHSNTKKGIISKLYHFVRNYTLNQKMRLVEKHVSRGTILDYGAGTGMFLKAAKDKNWNTYGTEPDSGARTLASKMGLKLFGDKAKLISEVGDSKFNAITLWHVLEHVTDLDDTLSFFSRYLAKDGVLIIAVPNRTSYDAKYYGQFWAAYDLPRHLYHFEINSLSQLLSKYNFSLLETLPMKFDSFYVSMLSEKYKTGSIRYLSAFFFGLKSNLKAKKAADYSSVIYVFKHK